MKVELLHHVPLHICSRAIRTCWDSHDKSDTAEDLKLGVEIDDSGDVIFTDKECGDKDKELINRIGNKMKHESVKNHIHYTFDIQGITTKTLLALTRHDIGVEFSVQSTRYTTSKCIKDGTAGYTKSKDEFVNAKLNILNTMIKECVEAGCSNDEISLLLPQAWQYNLVCTMSMTAVQHFLELRTKKDAHWDIQSLAKVIYDALPEEHKYLFEEHIND